MSNAKNILELRGVIKNYRQGKQNLEVLSGVDLEIAPEEIIALVGQSGSGKSTLLQIAGLLDTPTAGKIIINGENVGKISDDVRTSLRRDYIGFVYQYHNLLSDFTALENVMMPMLIAGAKRSEAEVRARELLGMVGMTHRAEHKPEALSGGEQQRVASARALINRPSVVLADEPTGNLDTATRDEIQRLFVELRDRTGQTFVIVTHDVALAERSDRTIRMSDGRVL